MQWSDWISERDVVVGACAASAGVHGALAPDHFAEGTAAGLGFAAAAVLLLSLAAVLTWRLARVASLVGAVTVLAGLIGSYAFATTSGLPVLHPEPEPVNGLALFTKAIEAVGLLGAIHLLRPKGTLT
jgi:hypothetical protein